MSKINRFFILSSLLLFTFGFFDMNAADKGKGDLSIGTLSYLQYEQQLSDEEKGRFKIGRSYLTVKKMLFKHLGFRITLDAYQDETGDMKVRLKYVYAHFKFGDFVFITKPNIEFGLVHMPWLDFEQKVNYYRMQGKMFMERSGLFNSADFGFTVGGLLGGQMDDDYKKKVNKKYPGRYGSFSFGLYNGGGYKAIEHNLFKSFQARFTLRPLPDIIPGLQFSWFGIFGKGNQKEIDTLENWMSPDWNSNAGMVSYEHQYFTLTGTYVAGTGNQKGKFVDDNNMATDYTGYSLFGEGKLGEHWRLIGRYDTFDKNSDLDNKIENRVIVGIGYDFGNHNILILDFDKTFYEDASKSDIDLVKLTTQIKF